MDDFQRDVLSFAHAANGRFIYADDMGLRKTATTLAYLTENHDVRTALVVVPKVVHVLHWLAESERYSAFVGFKGHGSAKQRAAAINQWATHGGLYVTTYDSMKADTHKLLACNIDAVVFDEGHRLKGRTTQVAKTANKFAKTPVCVIVTGTPVINKAEELWQYLHMLKPKTYTSFWSWAEEHFHVTLEYHGGHEHKVIGDYRDGHEDIVRQQLMGLIIQREQAEVFAGEAWVEEPDFDSYPIDMSAREEKLYRQLVEHGWGKLADGTYISASTALVQSTRIQQLASDWGTIGEVGLGSKVVAAVDDIVEWIRDGIPVLAFVEYQETANRVVQALAAKGIHAGAFHGGNPDKQADLEAFKKGHRGVLVGTYASMAEGVDGAQYVTHKVALIDLHWAAAIVDQAIKRAKRSGQHRRVQVRRYYFRGTIEESKYKANLRKVNLDRSLRGLDLKKVLYGGIEETDLVVDDSIDFGPNEEGHSE